MDEENLALLSMSPERSLVVTFPRANAKRTAASHVLTVDFRSQPNTLSK